MLANKGRFVLGLAEVVIQIELACMFVKVFLLGMKTLFWLPNYAKK